MTDTQPEPVQPTDADGVSDVAPPTRPVRAARWPAFILVLCLVLMIATGYAVHRLTTFPIAERAAAARAKLEKSYAAETIDDLLALNEDEFDIATAVLLLERELDPDLDLAAIRAEVDDIADAVLETMPARVTPRRAISLINEELYGARGFKAAVPPRRWWGNALSAVIRERAGSCLGMSLLYASVGQRLGIPLSIVDLPGHAMIAWEQPSSIVYIETTAGGHSMDARAVRLAFALSTEYRIHSTSKPATVCAYLLCDRSHRRGRKGDIDGRRTDARRAAMLDPTNVPTLVETAEWHEFDGDHDAALQAACDAITAMPLDPRGYVARATVHLAAGDVDQASADVERALDCSAQNVAAYVSRAQCRQTKREYDAALEDLDRAVQLDSQQGFALIRRAGFHIERAECAAALRDLERAIECDPNNPAGYQVRSLCYLWMAAEASPERASGAWRRIISRLLLGGNPEYTLAELIEKSHADARRAVELVEGPCAAWLYDARRFGSTDADRALECINEAIVADPACGDAWSMRARHYMNAKQYEAAIHDYSALVELEPGQAEWYLARAEAWYELDEHERVIADTTIVIWLERERARAYHLRSLGRFGAWFERELPAHDSVDDAEGEALFAAALEDLGQSLALDPDQSPCHGFVFSRLAYELKDYRHAVQLFDYLIAARPNDTDLYDHRGQMHEKLGNAESAAADYRMVRELGGRGGSEQIDRIPDQGRRGIPGQRGRALIWLRTSGSAYRCEARGEFWFKQKEYHYALAELDAAVTLSPDYMQYRHWRAWTLIRLERYADAIEDLNLTTAAEPEFAKDFGARAQCRYRLGQYTEGIADATRAIELDPNVAIYHHWRGWCHFSLNDVTAALSDFEVAARLCTACSRHPYSRGRCRLRLGDLDGAQSDFTTALERSPTYAWSHYYRGWARYLAGDFVGAVADFTAKIQSADHAGARSWRGVCRYRLGESDKAFEDLGWAITLEERAQWYVNRACVLQQLGEHQQADRDFRRAYELDASLLESPANQAAATPAWIRSPKDAGFPALISEPASPSSAPADEHAVDTP